MSNLSELLPTGGGQNAVDFVASGTLASGQTVVLKTDGTVEAVAGSGAAGSIGSQSTFSSAYATAISAVYDTNVNKFVVTYTDYPNRYGYAVVGTVSGTSISFGTPVVFRSSGIYSPKTAFHYDKTLTIYRDYGNTNTLQYIVGTVSGTSIGFGSPAQVASLSNIQSDLSLSYDATYGAFVATCNVGSSGTIIVGNMGGTTVNWGTPVNLASGEFNSQVASVYDPDQGKTVLFYRSNAASSYLVALVGSAGSNTFTMGTVVVMNSAATDEVGATYDTTSNKMVTAFRTTIGGAQIGSVLVGTVSGTSISFGSSANFTSGAYFYSAVSHDPTLNKILVTFRDALNSQYGTISVGTISGTSISFLPSYVLVSVTFNDPTLGILYDPDTNQNVQFYQDATNSNLGKGFVFTPDTISTNNTSFIGITSEAIANTATGPVNVYGGIAENASANLPAVLSAGAESTFVTSAANYCCAAYDVNSNKVVVVWAFGTPAYAAVGTVSGTSITFGTAVQFNNNQGSNFAIAYDSNVNKVAIVWTNSNQGTAIVGTVSGTSISFGAPNAFETSSNGSLANSIAFDSTANKFVIAYRNYGNSQYGTSVVATVTGTSIGFGTKVVFNSATTESTNVAYDSNANKSVIVYRDDGNSSYGTAIVGTVSGTSISFGAEAVYQTSTANDSVIAFDSNVNKLIIAYADDTNSNGKAIVGTVSGTSISFGTASIFYSTAIALAHLGGIVFNSSKNNAVISWRPNASPNEGTMIAATVSGTSVSFGPLATFNAGASTYIGSTYDSTSEKVVIVYKDQGNSNYGTASVISENAVTLTIASDYYVQSDGTLSTASASPAIKVGQAISATTINMKDLT